MEAKKKSVQIFSIKLKTPIKATEFKMTDYVEAYHDQDCCENVYIDFDHVEKQRDEINALGFIQHIELMSAPEEGVIVNLYNGEKTPRGGVRCSIFLACRNEQNGYYNSSLDIVFKLDGLVVSTNLNEFDCVVDHID